ARYAEARLAYERALQRDPHLTAASHALARLLHSQFTATQEALDRLDAMVARNPGNFEAYLIRAQFRRDFLSGRAGSPAAEDAITQAVVPDAAEPLRLAPETARALLLGAEVAQTAGDNARARELYQQGMRLHPRDPRMVRGLSWLEHCLGNDQAAIEALRRGCEAIPEDPDFPTTLAELLLREGQEEKVILVLKQLANRKDATDRVQYL